SLDLGAGASALDSERREIVGDYATRLLALRSVFEVDVVWPMSDRFASELASREARLRATVDFAVLNDDRRAIGAFLVDLDWRRLDGEHADPALMHMGERAIRCLRMWFPEIPVFAF